jgi:hypothetical protein
VPERSSDAFAVKLEASVQIDVLLPEGAHVWTAHLLHDQTTGEPRLRVSMKATCDSEDQARDTLRLAAGRISDALDEVSR